VKNDRTIAYVSVVHDLHDHRFLYKQCRGLVNFGFNVDYFVSAKKPEVIEGVKICPIKRPKRRLKRFIFTFSLAARLMDSRYAAVHLVDPELIPLGILLKIISNKVVLFDAHEDYLSFMSHKYYLNPFLAKVMEIGLGFLLRLSSVVFDGFVFADSETADLYSYMSDRKKCIFYNFPMLSMFPENNLPWRQREFEVCYLGTISVTRGIFVMIEALGVVKKQLPRLRSIFIGELDAYLSDSVNESLQRLGLENNVEFTKRIPHAMVPELLCNCKIGLIGLQDLAKFRRNIATKMFEYMACGVPVVSSDLPPERKFMDEGKQCIFVPPGESKKIAEAILSILGNPNLGTSMSTRCREQIVQKGFFAEEEIKKFALYYEKILESKVRGKRKS
jgi:glycosyltransferase involved in cell wall biosynthesis